MNIRDGETTRLIVSRSCCNSARHRHERPFSPMCSDGREDRPSHFRGPVTCTLSAKARQECRVSSVTRNVLNTCGFHVSERAQIPGDQKKNIAVHVLGTQAHFYQKFGASWVSSRRGRVVRLALEERKLGGDVCRDASACPLVLQSAYFDMILARYLSGYFHP